MFYRFLFFKVALQSIRGNTLLSLFLAATNVPELFLRSLIGNKALMTYKALRHINDLIPFSIDELYRPWLRPIVLLA